MKLFRKRGSTSNIIVVFLPDSSSTTGAGKTGLTSSSAGLNISLRRELSSAVTTYSSAGSTTETITTLGTFATPTATKCRFKEVDSTNQPGLYEIQFADALFDTSDASRYITGMITATGIAPVPMEIQLVAIDVQDAVRGGMTALPNTACTTNASLLTSGTGTDQISVSSGKVLLQATQTGVTIPTVTTVTNQLTAAQIATGVWQDSTAGDFTAASSIGKSLYTSGVVPGASGGLFIAGSNAATTISGLTTGALSCTTITASGAVAFQQTFAITGNTTFTGAISATNASNDILGILLQATQTGVTIPTVTTVTNQLSSSTIAGAVWDLATSGHTTSGTFGAAVVAAGSAGDPWATLLPGSYGAGTAGKIVGDNLNATVSSRSSHSAADVWAVATRVLTAGTNIALAKGTGVTGFNDLDAAGVRSAVGLATANLDTQISLLATASALSSLTTTVGAAGAGLTAIPKTGYKLASDGIDAILAESSISASSALTDDAGSQLTSINARQALSLGISALSGVLAGAASTSITIKPAGLPSGNTRITATVDADGNRSALTLKVPT